jgi:hypothetical protein
MAGTANKFGYLLACVIRPKRYAPGHSFGSIPNRIVRVACNKVLRSAGMKTPAAKRSSANTEEDILCVDVPDDALERAAAVAEERAITIVYCTNFYDCGWPL